MIDRKKYSKPIIFILAIYYLVGLLGVSFFPSVFIPLSWISLLASAVILAFFHEKINLKFLLAVTCIVFIGFAIEVFGVGTGLIFGDYIYGNGLGKKIYGVPIIIGLNWFVLVYCSNQISKYILDLGLWSGAAFSSLLMVFVDYILEWVAPTLDYWKFARQVPPLQNYVAWFFVSLFFSLSFGKSLTQNRNYLALPYLVIQITFFIFLIIIKLNS